MNLLVARITACAFITFFIAVVIIANRGEGNQWWGVINGIPNGDKVGHLVLTGTLSLLCNLAIPLRPCGRLSHLVTLPTLVLLVLLSLEELAQTFIHTRTCDFFDWLADLAGLALGQLAATRLDKIRHMITAFRKTLL